MLQDKDFSENTAFIKASLQIKSFCVTSQYLSITKSILAIQNCILIWSYQKTSILRGTCTLRAKYCKPIRKSRKFEIETKKLDNSNKKHEQKNNKS